MLNPRRQVAQANLAWVLATARKSGLRGGVRAVALAGEAVQNSGSINSTLLRVLAAGYAETGRFSDAAATARLAAQFAPAKGNTATAAAQSWAVRLGTGEVIEPESHLELAWIVVYWHELRPGGCWPSWDWRQGPNPAAILPG